jgi:D-serine deaminase-like pyridoxal phosphate-dependent protein
VIPTSGGGDVKQAAPESVDAPKADRFNHLAKLADVEALTTQPTPFLAVDLDVMEQNIQRMASYVSDRTVRLRPHVKHHKCSEIGRMQVEAGAVGVTCSTTDEIVAMVNGGIDDVLLANVVADQVRIDALAEVAGRATVTVALDSKDVAELISRAASRAGTQIGFVVDMDIGMGRNGVRSVAEGVRLAEQATELPGLEFRGVMAYEGHIMDIPDRAKRSQAVLEAFQPVGELVEALDNGGFDVQIVTGGSSATYESAGGLSYMTDLQCGTYVLMDATYIDLIPEFDPALAAIATVCTAGPGQDIVVNIGAKRLATDWGKPALAGYDAPHAATSEEHNQFTPGGGPIPSVGERVAVIPAHSCSTMASYSRVFAIRAGELERVFELDGRDPLS